MPRLYQRVAPALLFWASCVFAQVNSGSLAGTVIDPEGALVPRAKVTVSAPDHPTQSSDTDDFGVFHVSGLVAGRYSVTTEARGFSPATVKDVSVHPDKTTRLNLQLHIEIQQQQIKVQEDTADASPDHNDSAIVLHREELDTLSDNPQDLQLELQAMAGGGPGSNAQFYVDGFTAGRLPPKGSIREIRINQNPYSAQYDKTGNARIEISTKPGTDKLHGDLFLMGNDSVLNSRNPFVAEQPSYSSAYGQGDVNGPLSKFASYFLSAELQRFESESFVNAVTSADGTAFRTAVSSPQIGVDIAPRLDVQAGRDQTLSARYEFSRQTQDDLLSSQFSLPSQAIDTRNQQQTLQLSDTQTYGPHVVNETRFQYVRIRNNQLSQNDSPTVIVEGAFTGGGNNLGTVRDKQDQYEFQDYTSVAAGSHFIRFGGRWKATRDSNDSTANFNGEYIFASLTDYAAELPTLFSITTGQPGIAVVEQDLGLYAEDGWKFHPNMTFVYGMRFETQNHIHDHADFGPRFSYTWAVGATDKKPESTVLHAGAGLFYDRFTSDLVLNAARQNGIIQQEYIIQNPSYPDFPPLESSELPTIYRIAPLIHAPYTAEESVGIDETFWKTLTISTTWYHSRGIDQLLTRNINAPLPGMYPADPIRPLGTDQNIYEYQSEGASKRDRLAVKGNLRTGPVVLFGSMTLGFAKANTAGASSFPSNQYNLRADWGRAANDIRTQGYFGGFIYLPWNFQLTPFALLQSGTPFNITIGQDLNGDNQFNDRPAFATDLSRPSVYQTRFGNFDADPLPGQKIIPINYGNGPSLAMLNFAVFRDFHFGPPLPDNEATVSAPVKAGSKPVKKQIARKYDLSLGIEAQNLLNIVNPAPPVGVLMSPLFGQYTTLSTSGFSSTEANRIFYLDLRLSF
jgi:hypothetical protein